MNAPQTPFEESRPNVAANDRSLADPDAVIHPKDPDIDPPRYVDDPYTPMLDDPGDPGRTPRPDPDDGD